MRSLPDTDEDYPVRMLYRQRRLVLLRGLAGWRSGSKYAVQGSGRRRYTTAGSVPMNRRLMRPVAEMDPRNDPADAVGNRSPENLIWGRMMI